MAKDPRKAKKMTICKVARKSIGGPKLTQTDFAELTGVSMGLISQREREILDIKGPALTLYNLIAHCGRINFGDKVRETLEAVPKEERTEQTAVTALVLMMIREGHLETAAEALGVTPDKIEAAASDTKEGGLEDVVASNVRLLKGISESLEDAAKKAPPATAARLREAASKMASVIYDVERGLKELADAMKPPEPPDEP